MYNYIVFLLSKKKSYLFSEEFRRGYKNLWIDNIKDYTP
jgi:hypothetical protein